MWSAFTNMWPSFTKVLAKNPAELEQYLIKNKREIFARTNFTGNTILHLAVKEFSKILGAELEQNCPCAPEPTVVIHRAINLEQYQERIDQINLLCQYVDVEKKTRSGDYAVDFILKRCTCCMHMHDVSHLDFLKDMIDGLTTKKIFEDNRLVNLMWNSLWPVAMLALNKDVDTTVPLRYGETYFHMAFRRSAPVELIEGLISEEVASRADEDGRTPLYEACLMFLISTERRTRIFKALLAANATTELSSNLRSPLALYIRQLHQLDTEVFDLILEKSAQHMTPRDMASVLLYTIVTCLRYGRSLFPQDPRIKHVVTALLTSVTFPRWNTLVIRPENFLGNHTAFKLQINDQPNLSCSVHAKDLRFLAQVFSRIGFLLAEVPQGQCPFNHSATNMLCEVNKMNQAWREHADIIVNTPKSLERSSMDVVISHLYPVTEEKLRKTPLPSKLINMYLEACEASAEALCEELTKYL